MSVNDFNRGTESQARAHYAFMRKQGEATAELGKRIIKKIDEQGNIIDHVIDVLSQQERERIFGISQYVDIKELDRNEHIILLAYLNALIMHRAQTTEQQYDYFNNLRKYLNIETPSKTINFESVSEMDISRSELKAFLLCVCEFLFLKTGSRAFLDDFACELEQFGLSNQIINDIVVSIENTYEFFGVNGIVQHYDLEPIKREKEEEEPLRIPFFEKPFAIIYNGKEKHHGEYAEMLKATIEEHLGAIGVDKPQIRIEDENKLESKIRMLEETRHLIFIGTPKLAKDLMSAMKGKWAFDKFGIRFGTFGEKSIITVSALKKKQYKDFFNYAQEQQLRQKSDIEKNLKSQEDTILKTVFDKDEPLAVNILAGFLGSWLIVPSALLDWSTISEEKEKLIGLQYGVAIDSFISSKIDPYTSGRK